MRLKFIITIIFASVFSYSFAQKSTEIFIPIGKSPGLLGKYTELGKVQNFNAHDSIITIMIQNRSKTIKIKNYTKIWLDYSKLQLPNKVGTFRDIKEGLLVEMKYLNNKTDKLIEWIKIEIK